MSQVHFAATFGAILNVSVRYRKLNPTITANTTTRESKDNLTHLYCMYFALIDYYSFLVYYVMLYYYISLSIDIEATRSQ